MPEEQKKEEKKEEKKEQEKAPEEKSTPQAPAADKKETAAKKKRKINRLTLKEVEKRIQDVQEKMGSLTSRYGQQLLKQKEKLLRTGADNAANK